MRPGRRGPGNRTATRNSSSAGSRFNEAGAARPRKLADISEVYISVNWASMRPGRRGPGNDGRPNRHRRGGTGFNEAGAARPRKPAQSARSSRRSHPCFNEAGAARPRKRLPCKRLWHSAELGCFRAGPCSWWNTRRRGYGKSLHDFKEPNEISMKCRIEQPPVEPRRRTARLTPAKTCSLSLLSLTIGAII